MKMSRRFASTLAGLTALGACAALLVAGAPSASALLCGYPPKACPAGQTNPTNATTVAPGILLLANSEVSLAPRTYPVRVSVLDRNPKLASDVKVSTAEPFRGSLRRLPSNSSAIVSIVMNDGKLAPIGVIKTDSHGYATLPAVRLSQPRPTTFVITLQDGDKRYVNFIPFLP
jgi:hypothetical protein